MKLTLSVIFLLLTLNLKAQNNKELIVSSDIDNFWQAYDKINTTQDSALQYKYLDDLFLNKGTPGLKAIMEVKNYTAQSYINAIHNYPIFWASVRKNTMRSDEFVREMRSDIDKLKAIFPELKPAPIYFTIGALRTNGTISDGKILIGAELAMTDRNTISSEFEEPFASARRKFFDSEPINDIVILNVHEYVHTQQHEMVHNLLSQCIYEGVAEFVAITATGKRSPVPAIKFGKEHGKEVFAAFEKDMFRPSTLYKWLWGDVKNDFDVRDLGYYIGYAFCEKHYEKASDKKAMIKELINLDYNNEDQIEKFVNSTGLLSLPLSELYDNFEKGRPTVLKIDQFMTGDKNVNPDLKEITIHFSTEMNTQTRGFDYGPLGENHVLSVKSFKGFSEDGKSATLEVELKPSRQYQVLITNQFSDINGAPLKPFLIDIQTASPSK